MGESISEATISTIFKPSGSYVMDGEEILELETDKVNQPIYAEKKGQLQLNVATGERVVVDQVIGYIEAKENEPAMQTQNAQANNGQNAPTPSQARKSQKDFVEQLKQPEAKEQAIIQPEAREQSIKPAEEKIASNDQETRKKMTRIRKVISERLVKSLHQSAMLTTFNEADMSEISLMREKYKEKFLKIHEIKLGLMPFFVKAAVEALKATPNLNAYIDGDDIVYRKSYDIGIAVSTERGLMVPVVRNCDQLSFVEIEKAIAQYAVKARDGHIAINDLQGAGFTITNGGVYGSLLSTPILNPPQSGILGMHKIMKRAVVVDDVIVIRPMMYLALSYDHRIVDGKEAVMFLVKVKEILEQPSSLLFIPD